MLYGTENPVPYATLRRSTRRGMPILVSEDGLWISNGRWLLKTTALDPRVFPKDYARNADAVRSWLAGWAGAVHAVAYPSLRGQSLHDITKPIRDAEKAGELIAYRRTPFLFERTRSHTSRVYVSRAGEIRLVDKVDDDAFKIWMLHAAPGDESGFIQPMVNSSVAGRATLVVSGWRAGKEITGKGFDLRALDEMWPDLDMWKAVPDRKPEAA